MLEAFVGKSTRAPLPAGDFQLETLSTWLEMRGSEQMVSTLFFKIEFFSIG